MLGPRTISAKAQLVLSARFMINLVTVMTWRRRSVVAQVQVQIRYVHFFDNTIVLTLRFGRMNPMIFLALSELLLP